MRTSGDWRATEMDGRMEFLHFTSFFFFFFLSKEPCFPSQHLYSICRRDREIHKAWRADTSKRR